MPGNVGNLSVGLSADVVQFQGDMGRAAAIAEREAKRIERAVKGGADQLVSFGKGLLAALGVPLTAGAALAFFDSLKEKAAESERSVNQLNAVLKATGGSAGLTAKDLEGLNTELQGKTVFDDDEIRRAETALLRFRRVQGEVFREALRLGPDLAAALGTDLSSAMVKLGRATTDPERGLRQLKDAGLKLSEQQIDMAARMREAGDVAGAQHLVLDTLAKSIGGAGEADNTGLYGASKRLARAFGDLEKAGGRQLFGSSGQNIDVVTEALERMRKKAEESKSSLLDLFLHPIDAARGFTEQLRALFGVQSLFDRSSPPAQRSVSGKISNAELAPDVAAATDAAREQSLAQREDALYVKQQDALKKRAANSAAFYQNELQEQRFFLDQQQIQLEDGYARGFKTIKEFFDGQRSLNEQTAAAQRASLQKQIGDQQAVIASPRSDENEKEAARIRILQLGTQARAIWQAAELKNIQLANQEVIANEKLADSFADIRAQLNEARGSPDLSAGEQFDIAHRHTVRELEALRDRGTAEQSDTAKDVLDEVAQLRVLTVEKAARAVRNTIDQIEIELRNLQGDTAGATALQLRDRNEELRQTLQFRGDSASLDRLNQLEQLQVAQAKLNDVSARYGLILDGLSVAQGRIDLDQQTGAITEIDAINRKAEAAKAYIEVLQREFDLRQKIANSLPEGAAKDAELVKLQQLRLEMDRVAAQADVLAKKFNDVFANSFADAITNFVTGTKSLRDTIKDLGKTLESQLVHIAAQNVSEQLFGKNGPLGGVGSLFAKIFGGGKEDKSALGALDGTSLLTGAGTSLTGAGTVLTSAGSLLTAAATSLEAAAATMSANGAASALGGFGGFGGPFPGGSLFGGFGDFAGFPGFERGTDAAPGGIAIVGERGAELVSAAPIAPLGALRAAVAAPDAPVRDPLVAAYAAPALPVLALVGRDGPQLVDLPRGAQVIPNDIVRTLLTSERVFERGEDDLIRFARPSEPELSGSTEGRAGTLASPSSPTATLGPLNGAQSRGQAPAAQAVRKSQAGVETGPLIPIEFFAGGPPRENGPAARDATVSAPASLHAEAVSRPVAQRASRDGGEIPPTFAEAPQGPEIEPERRLRLVSSRREARAFVPAPTLAEEVLPPNVVRIRRAEPVTLEETEREMVLVQRAITLLEARMNAPAAAAAVVEAPAVQELAGDRALRRVHRDDAEESTVRRLLRRFFHREETHEQFASHRTRTTQGGQSAEESPNPASGAVLDPERQGERPPAGRSGGRIAAWSNEPRDTARVLPADRAHAAPPPLDDRNGLTVPRDPRTVERTAELRERISNTVERFTHSVASVLASVLAPASSRVEASIVHERAAAADAGAVNVPTPAASILLPGAERFVSESKAVDSTRIERELRHERDVLRLGAILGLPAFASGTPAAPGGLAVVGERGPEIVHVPQGAQVIPNHVLKATDLAALLDLPAFASGTSSAPGGPALVGERGIEVIVPQQARVVPNDVHRSKRSGVTVHAPINITVAGNTTTRTANQIGVEVHRALNRSAARFG